jgi:adenylate cyclase
MPVPALQYQEDRRCTFRIDPSDTFTVPKTNRSRTSLSPIQYAVGYTGLSLQCCVGIVDLVKSTKVSAHMPPDQLGKYYEIFLNSISKELYKFGGFVVKNVGDGLLFYFSDPPGSKQKTSFRASLDCSLAITESHEKICRFLHKEGLPDVDFRISLDSGKVIIMKTSNCTYIDIIGPPVNMCSKINHIAKINGLAIGGDLYEIVKKFKGLQFTQQKGFGVDGLKVEYPVYNVHKK